MIKKTLKTAFFIYRWNGRWYMMLKKFQGWFSSAWPAGRHGKGFDMSNECPFMWDNEAAFWLPIPHHKTIFPFHCQKIHYYICHPTKWTPLVTPRSTLLCHPIVPAAFWKVATHREGEIIRIYGPLASKTFGIVWAKGEEFRGWKNFHNWLIE